MTTPPPYRIAIASGKGGTGKTFVAVHLAKMISTSASCTLVDLDVEEPNDSIFFPEMELESRLVYKQIPEWNEERCTLCGLCSKTCKFHAVMQLGDSVIVFNELCHSCYACSELCPNDALPMKNQTLGTIGIAKSTQLTFVESRLKVGEEQAVPLIKKTHRNLQTEVNKTDYILYDCPPGTSCPVVAATKPADLVLLVTEPTPFGLNDLKLAVETLRKTQKPMAIIINRYGIGYEDVEQYCEIEKLTVIAKIPYSRKIAEAYALGHIITESDPELLSQLKNVVDFIKLHRNENA